MEKIIGRVREMCLFQELLASDRSEFIAVYGRRRVGKTFLISEFFQTRTVYFEVTGRNKASKASQLKNFETVFADTFHRGVKDNPATNWDDALDKLRRQVEGMPTDKKILLFFDELPWLASRKSGFLESLDLFWNRYISRMPNVILIVCGSAAAWMIDKVVNNKGGLHNRFTRAPVNLRPFTLGETERYLQHRKVSLERKQIVELYMALGGVAHYLSLVPRGKSVAEILSALFFEPQAPLLAEFQRLFDSLFQKPKRHIEVITLLSKKHQGLEQSELFSPHTSLTPGGGAVTVLEELEHCGFISRISQFGNKKKAATYRLTDPFSLFYLCWVKENTFSPNYWQQKMASQAYHSWSGYIFENICLLHYQEIVAGLKLSVIAQPCTSWHHRSNENEYGAQIDLIIDRNDNSINLCEVKFYNQEFVVSKSYAHQLNQRKSYFQAVTKTKKNLFTTLISVYGATENSNYHNSVDSQLRIDTLFAEL